MWPLDEFTAENGATRFIPGGRQLARHVKVDGVEPVGPVKGHVCLSVPGLVPHCGLGAMVTGFP